MANKEIKELSSSLSEVLGKVLENDIEKCMLSVFENEELSVGIRSEYELIEKKVVFTSFMMLEDNDSIVDDKYKPKELSHNEYDFYFASEEIARFNSRETFFAVIGKRYFKNRLEDEFVEAIIFGTHNISSIDCMLGSVRTTKRFNTPNYLAPGALVSLRRVEFGETKYLEVETFLTKMHIGDTSGNVWNIKDFQNIFYWNGRAYTTNRTHRILKGEYYDNPDVDEFDYEDIQVDYDEDEYYDNPDIDEFDYEEIQIDYDEDEYHANCKVMDYATWLRTEFGDDADTAYWNTH